MSQHYCSDFKWHYVLFIIELNLDISLCNKHMFRNTYGIAFHVQFGGLTCLWQCDYGGEASSDAPRGSATVAGKESVRLARSLFKR